MLYFYGFSEEVLKDCHLLSLINHKILSKEDVPFSLKKEIIDLSLGFIINLEVVDTIEIPPSLLSDVTIIPPEYLDYYINTGEIPNTNEYKGASVAGFPVVDDSKQTELIDRDSTNRVRKEDADYEVSVEEAVLEPVVVEKEKVMVEAVKEEPQKVQGSQGVNAVFDQVPDDLELSDFDDFKEDDIEPNIQPVKVETLDSDVKDIKFSEPQGLDTILTLVDDIEKQLQHTEDSSVEFDTDIPDIGGSSKKDKIIEQLQSQIEELELRFKEETDTLVDSYNDKIKFLESRLKSVTLKLGQFIIFADNPIRRNIPSTTLKELHLKSKVTTLSPCYDVFSVLKNLKYLAEKSNEGVVIVDLSNTVYLPTVLKTTPASVFNLKADDVVIENCTVNVGNSVILSAGVFNDITLLITDFDKILKKIDKLAKGRQIFITLGCFSTFNNRYTSTLLQTLPDSSNYLVVRGDPLKLTSLLYGFVKFVGSFDVLVLDYIEDTRKHLDKVGIEWFGFKSEKIEWDKLK